MSFAWTTSRRHSILFNTSLLSSSFFTFAIHVFRFWIFSVLLSLSLSSSSSRSFSGKYSESPSLLSGSGISWVDSLAVSMVVMRSFTLMSPSAVLRTLIISMSFVRYCVGILDSTSSGYTAYYWARIAKVNTFIAFVAVLNDTLSVLLLGPIPRHCQWRQEQGLASPFKCLFLLLT